MNTFLLVTLIVLPAAGALIAWLGDVIGYRLGKSRRTLFGLRPRSTARVIGVIVGAVLPLLGIGVAAVGSDQVRIALLHLDELRRHNRDLQADNDRLQADRTRLEGEVKQFSSLADDAERKAREAQQSAREAQSRAAAAR